MAISRAQINGIKDYATRTLLLGMYDQIDAHNQILGVNMLEPVNSTQKPASAPPPLATLAVSGANGSFAAQITNPALSINKVIYHELSYSSSSSFTSDVTTLPVQTSTGLNVPAPGVNAHWRIRSSYDQKNWNAYQMLPQPVAAGLQSSAASEAATVLNQTNYGNVDSASNVAGTAANIRIYGKAGPNTQFPSVKGTVEMILPSATLINVPFSSQQVVGFQAQDYVARGTLPEVLVDGMTPIGAVSVVGSGAIVLPVVTVTVNVSGIVTAWNVVSGGNALSDPVSFSIVDVGTGATAGAQTIMGGVLISIANGLGGSGYTPGTQAVTVTGGVFAGAAGGGRNIGGNGGRLIINDGTLGG